MRAFIAIDLPEGIRNRIGELQEELKQCKVNVKFVEKENLHVTLLFLGERAASEVNAAAETLSRCAGSCEPFTLSLQGAGYFGKGNHITTLWVGIAEGNAKLRELTETIARELHITQKGREFHPHVTMGRVRSGRNKEALLHKLSSLEDVKVGEVEVTQLTLKQSTLTPQGPLYADIHTADFTAA